MLEKPAELVFGERERKKKIHSEQQHSFFFPPITSYYTVTPSCYFLFVSFLYSHYIFTSSYFYSCETSFHCAGIQTSVPESYYIFAKNDPGKGFS